MCKKYYKQYQYYSFYQKITDTSKIIINIFTDSKTRYINISEINMNGKLTDAECDFLAMEKINAIESLV